MASAGGTECCPHCEEAGEMREGGEGGEVESATAKRQLAREHSRRKQKRRRERAWAGLAEALAVLRAAGINPDTGEPVRALREPVGAEAHAARTVQWDDVPPCALPAINSRKRAELSTSRLAPRHPACFRNFTACMVVVHCMMDLVLRQAFLALHATANSPLQGETRKRDQAEGYTRILAAAFDPTARLKVVDFGCGSGNLTVMLAWRFPLWQFVGIDMNPTCIELLEKRAADGGIPNLRGVTGMVDTAAVGDGGTFDIAIALHACGNATDDALRRAEQAGAAFVVSPCCAGKMSKSISGGAALGIDTAHFATIVSFADHAADESRSDARSAKRVIEMDRLAWARANGYSAALLALTADLAYPKNDVLVGLPHPTKVDPLLTPDETA